MGLTMNGDQPERPAGPSVSQPRLSRSRRLAEVATGIRVSELTSRQFLAEIDAAVAIYANAMEADPAVLPGRRELMRRHAGYPNFRALHARTTPAESSAPADGTSPSPRTSPSARNDCRDHLSGFAYGFHGQGGQWWYDAVWTALSRALGAGHAASWLADCFEVAEVHVLKQHQRAGVGTTMLTALTSGRPERTALLSTPDLNTTARRLYRRMGFSELLTGYSFPGGSPPYILMGAELPLRDPTADPVRPLSASPSIS